MELDAVLEASGSEGGWSIDRRPVLDVEGVCAPLVGLSATDQARDESDSVCSEDTCRCWTLLAVGSSGVDEGDGLGAWWWCNWTSREQSTTSTTEPVSEP